MPPGVQIVATCREGTAPARLPDGELVTLVRIDAADPDNRRDIERFLASQARQAATTEQLAAAGMSPDEFTTLLAERCQGVWIYLRYVLAGLRQGAWDREDVDRLPSGLANYYRQQVTAGHGPARVRHPGRDLAGDTGVR